MGQFSCCCYAVMCMYVMRAKRYRRCLRDNRENLIAVNGKRDVIR